MSMFARKPTNEKKRILETITKCQTFLNIINKTTRLAERKANVGNSQPTE